MRGLHHRLGMTLAAQTDLQRRWVLGDQRARAAGVGRGSGWSLWRMAGDLPGALRAASGSSGRQQQQEAFLWPPVRLPQTGSKGEGWRGSQKQLNKYRFASFLSAQRMVWACLIHGKLRQARVLNTTHFSVPLFCFILLSTVLLFLPTQLLNQETSSRVVLHPPIKNISAVFGLLTDTKALHSCLEKYQTASSFLKYQQTIHRHTFP